MTHGFVCNTQNYKPEICVKSIDKLHLYDELREKNRCEEYMCRRICVNINIVTNQCSLLYSPLWCEWRILYEILYHNDLTSSVNVFAI